MFERYIYIYMYIFWSIGHLLQCIMVRENIINNNFKVFNSILIDMCSV